MKSYLFREAPGVGVLLGALFLFSVLGLMLSAGNQIENNFNDTLVFGSHGVRAALKVDTVTSQEVLELASALAEKSQQMNHDISPQELEKAVDAVFQGEHFEVSSLIDFSTLIREMKSRSARNPRAHLGLTNLNEQEWHGD